MADITQVAGNVRIGAAGAGTEIVQANAAITQGAPCYYDSSTQKHGPADANNSETTAAAVGIALTPADADGDYFVLAKSGTIDLGTASALTVGTMYIVSGTASKIAPIADAVTGWYMTTLGVATTTDAIALNPNASGAQVP